MGKFWWLLSLLGSLLWLLSVCGMIGNLYLVEFLGGAFLIILFIWLSLHLKLGVFFLISYLVCLCLHTVEFFISRCCLVLAFSFFYIENTKILGIFHCWHLIFWVLIIDLSTCKEILHLIWNFITKLKIAFWKTYHLLGIEVRTLHCIHICLFYLLSHNIISFTTALFLSKQGH